MKVDKKIKLNVVIVGASRAYVNLMEGMGHNVTCINHMPEALKKDYCDVDVLLFTGGADVNPKLYGHSKHPTTGYSEADDELCLTVFNKSRIDNPNIKMAGICRGSQFLCVMAGGKLVQDVGGHAIWGTHKVTDFEGETYNVTSTHHQMQFPCDVQHKVLASADISHGAEMHVEGEVVKVDLPMDYESVWYPGIKALGFQPHPEFAGADNCRELFVKHFNQFIVYSVDFIK